jgi:predicted RNA binding protein YcfA (HicA-like mRNA interferase family)
MATSRMIETTHAGHDMPGTPQEVIANLVALGWEVVEEREARTFLQHPLLTGTTRQVLTPSSE